MIRRSSFVQYIFAIILPCSIGFHSGAQQLSWTLKNEVVIPGEKVLVSDILTVEDGGQLPDLVLHDAPVVGDPLHWHRSRVFQMVNEKFPGLLKDHGEGAIWVKVRKQSRMFDQAELLDLLHRSLDRMFMETRGVIEFELTREWTPVRVPEGPVEMELIGDRDSRPSAYSIIKFHLTSRDLQLGPWFVQLKCRCLEDVLVSRRPIQRGEILREDAIQWETRDVLSLRSPLTRELVDPDDPFEAVRTLREGEPILMRDVRRQPLVQRRDIVTAILDRGALQISIKALSEEEGYKGDIIRVINLRSNKEFHARVIRPNLVELAY